MSRAMLTMEELMAMALPRSARSSTICTRKAWRPGMSKALMMPCITLSASTQRMVMRRGSVSAASSRDCTMASVCVQTSTWRRSRRSTQTPAKGPAEGGNLAGEADGAQQQRRSGEAIDQPAGGDAGHPGADEGDALAAEEEPEVAMAKGPPGVRAAGLDALLGGGGRLDRLRGARLFGTAQRWVPCSRDAPWLIGCRGGCGLGLLMLHCLV